VTLDLNHLWGDQFELQQLWHDWPTLSESERNRLAEKLLLHLHEEVAEFQGLVDQDKYHLLKARRDVDQRVGLAEAGVDVMRLLIALLALRGVTPEMFDRAWGVVGDRVREKWRWEQDELSKALVLLCDLDGCVTLHAEGFRRWCDERGHKLGDSPNGPELEHIKDEFHSSGGFTGLDPYPGAIEVLNRWRRVDNERRLVIVTARPYKQHRQVHSDTVMWLRRNKVAYDHVMFERDKSEAVRQVQPARIVAHIEDRGKHALEVASTGTTVLKLPFGSREEQISHPKIIGVANWHDIEQHLWRFNAEEG
jgi:hypothetical protein